MKNNIIKGYSFVTETESDLLILCFNQGIFYMESFTSILDKTSIFIGWTPNAELEQIITSDFNIAISSEVDKLLKENKLLPIEVEYNIENNEFIIV